MASESVATERRIPRLSDLLVNSYTLEDPEITARACENVLLPVTSGIQAIGRLLVSAVNPDAGCEHETFADAGYLLEFLADLQGDVQRILSNARHDLLERAKQAQEA